MNVGQGLLDDTKDGQFQVGREPPEVLGNIEIDLQVAAFHQTLHIPPDGLRQTIFIQQRRMQKIGRSADLLVELLHQILRVIQSFGQRRIFLCLLCHAGEIHAQRRYNLTGTIVQLARNMPSLLILRSQQPDRQLAKLLRLLQDFGIALLQLLRAITHLALKAIRQLP